MGNFLGGGGTSVDGTYLQIHPNLQQFTAVGGSSSSSIGGVVGGQEGNGQWNIISSGASSFNDGKNQYTGSQMYSNVNGEVHHETTGNMPQGFFQSFSSTPTATVSAIALVSMVMMVAIFSIFIRMTRKNQQRRQLELRNRRNLIMTSSGRDLSQNPQQNQGLYFNQQKRPFADVMWNSELLAQDQFVEVKVDE